LPGEFGRLRDKAGHNCKRYEFLCPLSILLDDGGIRHPKLVEG
jgi:hypothetical protein